MKNARGFTLVEILIALVLFGIVSMALYQLLISSQRVYQQQSERVSVNESARAAISILPGEIREVSAGGGDIVAMSASALTYKSMQSLYVQCQPPNAGGLQIVLDHNTFFGLQGITAGRDSILIFAEGDSTTRTDDGWLHANVTATAAGTACPGGRPSIAVTLSGVTATQLGGVLGGAPVRTFRVGQILLYQDAGGAWWLGARQFVNAGATWGTTQPIVGPMTSTGLAMTYFDKSGTATANTASVARVGITVVGQSAQQVRGAGGTTYLLQNLVTQVAVRNNPLY